MGEASGATEPGGRPTSGRWLRWYGSYALFAVLFWLTTRLTDSPRNAPDLLNAWIGVEVGLLAGAAYALFAVYRIALFRARSLDGLLAEVRADLPRIVERVVGGCWFLALGIVVFRSFLHWKPLIGSLVPYLWDPWLAKLDRLLHLGVDPWEVSTALLDRWTAVLDLVYVSWFSVKVGAFVLFASFRPLRERAHFYWAMALMYLVGGTLLAHGLASGGPAFYGRLTGDTARFEGIWPYLDDTRALFLQNRLWRSMLDPTFAVPFSGISAMPSIHVAFVVLLASWGWDTNRWVGTVTTAYAILIFIGSFHLGWHYAVDGYLGALVGWGCWRVAGRIVTGSGT